MWMNGGLVKELITSIIRPTLEYATVVWNLHLRKDTDEVEEEQRAASRRAPTLRDLNYEDSPLDLQH